MTSTLPDAPLSPADIEVMVHGASIIELAYAIPSRSEEEFDLWCSLRDLFGAGRFSCPRCQLGKDRAPLIMRLDAVVLDSVYWQCEACWCKGTRWELIDLLLRDPVALCDFLEGTVTCVGS